MKESCILFILHLPPPIHGAAMVGKYIHDSKLINEQLNCHYINLAMAASLEDIGKVGVKKIWHYLRLIKTIRKEVKELKPDLVYITPNAKGGAFYKEWLIVMMLKAMGCRVVAHYHNKGVSTRQNKWLDNLLYRKFFKDIKVILLAEALYPDIQKYVSLQDVSICPNGIPTLQKENGNSGRKKNSIPHVLFLSNLIVSKGVLVLLDALALLKEKGCSFICDIVGGETKEIDVPLLTEEIKRRKLQNDVVYHGKKYGNEKESIIEASDLFVFPTFYHNECFPLVLLEAMEQRLPIITTNEGGITDIVKDGENGLICKQNDALSLVGCIQKLIENPELRKRMGEDGRKKFEEQFTLEVFEQRLLGILRELTEANGCNR